MQDITQFISVVTQLGKAFIDLDVYVEREYRELEREDALQTSLKGLVRLYESGNLSREQFIKALSAILPEDKIRTIDVTALNNLLK